MGVLFLGEDRLAVVPQRGSILVETLDREDLLTRARTGLSRGFTAEECRQYRIEPCPTLDEVAAGPTATR
jgi:hypothetical protein